MTVMVINETQLISGKNNTNYNKVFLFLSAIYKTWKNLKDEKYSIVCFVHGPYPGDKLQAGGK
jgi:hypothetical protein